MRNDPNHPRPTRDRPLGVPSRRVVGALVACALGAGLLVGASLAPAPPSSLASSSTVVSRLLALLAAQQTGGGVHAGAPLAHANTTPPTTAGNTSSATTTRAPASAAATGHAAQGSATGAGGGEGSASTGAGTATGGKEGAAGEHKSVRLPPISHVWLVVLAGQSFSEAATAPAAYPYLTGQLLKGGTLLEHYSAIEAYELAGDAALLTGGIGESVSTISQPCAASPGDSASGGGSADSASGSATAATTCPATAGSGQSETDAFLQRVVAPILASSAYGERGLVVVTFGNAAQEPGPPALSATTLGSTPPAGALLLSQILRGGGHSAEAFDSLAPRQSLEAIFAAS